MTHPGTLRWFARHESRLAWRDWLYLMTAGHRRRVRSVAIGFVLLVLFMHGLAYLMLLPSAARIAAGTVDRPMLVSITATLALAWPLMLSQAMESVTRAFYARGDLELILASPAAAARLFAVRIAAMAATIAAMTLAMAAPFLDVLLWLGGAHWLAGYAVTLALAMAAVAVAVLLMVGLFRAVGPKRTRVIAQIVAAVTGAAFVIGVQFAAIVAYGTMSDAPAMLFAALLRLAPATASPLWWPARAAMGDLLPLMLLVGLATAALGAVIAVFAPRFGRFALAAGGAAHGPAHHRAARPWLHDATPVQALRRKEWTLLLRDPWLLSQSLMQLLYLLPPVLLLWHNFYTGSGASALLVPILIVAAGQLGGGLAWLAISGEDAPDLIASAPVPPGDVLRAKAEAVIGGIVIVFAPFVLMLAVLAPFSAAVAAVGVAVSTGSAMLVQFWFRTQARRSLFRRRQTSSRIATFAEALSSIGWAGCGALAAAESWLAVVPGVLVLAILAGAWMVSPARNPALTG